MAVLAFVCRARFDSQEVKSVGPSPEAFHSDEVPARVV